MPLPCLFKESGRFGDQCGQRGVDIEPNPNHEAFQISVAVPFGFDENAADLPPLHQKVVRPLEGRLEAKVFFEHLGDASAGELREARRTRGFELRAEKD